MAWEEVASGNLIEFYSGLRQYDYLIPEGSRGKLQLNLRAPVSRGVAQTVENALVTAGIPNVKVTTSSPTLNIFFKKGFPWLPVIVGVIIPLLAILAILIISWQLYKESPAMGFAFLATVAFAATFIGMTVLRRQHG